METFLGGHKCSETPAHSVLEASCREKANVAHRQFLNMLLLFRVHLSRVQNSWGRGYDIKIIRASLGNAPSGGEPTPIKITVPNSSRERSQLLLLTLSLAKFQETRAKTRASRLPVILGQETPRCSSSKPGSRKAYYAGEQLSVPSATINALVFINDYRTPHTLRPGTLTYSIQNLDLRPSSPLNAFVSMKPPPPPGPH